MANPQIEFWQLDNAIDPSGTRDQGLAGSGFVKRLDTSTSGHMDFGTLNITTSGVYAGTKQCFFRVSDLGSASQVFNLRFYLSSLSAWGVGDYAFKWSTQIGFTSGIVLGDSNDSIPVSLPSSSNVLTTQSGTYIQAAAESGCSEYIALDLFCNTDVPVGTYGGAGNGGFRYRLTYDFG